ncbi:MAG: DUF4494 family protein [Bacteroidia bacterium]
MFYSVKIKYQEPKEGTDEMKKVTKSYLVYALSVTEAEMRISNWIPSNFQDPVVQGVQQTNIGEIKEDGPSETFWLIKFMDDADGTQSKAKPYFVVLNANNIDSVVQKIKGQFAFMEAEEIKKFKPIVDDDLISEEIPTRKLIPIGEVV